MIRVKRAYDPAAKGDGYRVLIDRLWPRGMKKADFQMDEWAKDLAPSTDLRQALHKDPEQWKDFQRRYRQELRTEKAQEHLEALAGRARRGTVTLLSSSRDNEHNHVPVLQQILERKLKH